MDATERNTRDNVRGQRRDNTVSIVTDIKRQLHTHCENVTRLKRRREESGIWLQRQRIVQHTTDCVNELLEILKDALDRHNDRFRQSLELYPLVFGIGKVLCEIVCKLCKQIARSDSSESINYVADMVQIPDLFFNVMGYLTLKPFNDSSDTADNLRVSMDEIKRCKRRTVLTWSDFCECVCKEMTSGLNVMTKSIVRDRPGFKELLICEVKQYLYIQQASELARDVFNVVTKDEKHVLDSYQVIAYKKANQQLWNFLRHWSRVLDTVRFDETSMSEVEWTRQKIKTCMNSLKNNVQSGQEDRGEAILKKIWREIQNVSFDVCEDIVSCLPPGQKRIGKDVTALHISDIQDSDLDSDDENSSDFDSMGDENSSDFIGCLTKITLENDEDLLKGSDIDRTELIQSYKMDGFKTPVEVCVENHGPFSCPVIGGKVRSNKKWIPAVKVKVEKDCVKMTIDPGEYFVVYYTFPSRQQTFNGDEVKKGVTMRIPDTPEMDGSIRLPPSNARDVIVKCKIHLPDQNRLKGYREESPDVFDSLEILPGIQTSVTGDMKRGAIELPKDDDLKKAAYILFSIDLSFKDWTCTDVQPVTQDRTMSIDVPFAENSVNFIVKDTKNNQSPAKKDTDYILTALGVKSSCKLLTLYRIPEENKKKIVDLRVYCIESKRFLLKRTAKAAHKYKWRQIQNESASSDFLIRSENKITFDLSENLKPLNASTCPTLLYIQGGDCFAEMKLQFLDATAGRILMNHEGKSLDVKQLVWEHLTANNEETNDGARQIKPTDQVQQKTKHCLIL